MVQLLHIIYVTKLMLLSNIFQTLNAQTLANAKSPEHMDYKYSYSDDHICTWPPEATVL